MSALLMGPAFEPCERFYLLTLALEEVPTECYVELLPVVTMTANVVLRQLTGKVTSAEAFAATPAPPTVEERTE